VSNPYEIVGTAFGLLSYAAFSVLGVYGWSKWARGENEGGELPYWDSSITVLSLLAQWMMARKYLENWALWIAVDLLGIGVYQTKGLYATAGLYVVFLVLATSGLVAWWRAWDLDRRTERAAA